MSKPFYPTNDGHIGNLRKLPTIEIRDLLKRQQDLLKKKQSLLNKFPDKGARIKKHLEDFQQELRRRESDVNTEEQLLRDGIAVVSQNIELSAKNIHTDHVKNDKAVDVQEKEGNLLLEKELQKLSVKDADNEVKGHGRNDIETSEKHKHYFEVALERAEQNLQSGFKQPVKLNRALKVENIQDLPEDIKKMKDLLRLPNTVKHHSKMECNQPKVNEESAVVPPNYKYSEVKMIDINESLQLQIQQKQIQEELNAQLAAEKLAERLHIKMEEYNPEGTDMSYRVTKGNGYTDDIDSDDDIDEDVENASYSKTLVPSDTED